MKIRSEWFKTKQNALRKWWLKWWLKWWRNVILCIIFTAVFEEHTLEQIQIPMLQRIENIWYDFRLRNTTPNTIDPNIVILDIDEKSLAAEGRWPWRRDRLVELMDIVFGYCGAKVLGFDMVFSEPEKNAAMEELDKLAKTDLQQNHSFLTALEKVRPWLAFDDKFAKSLQNRPIVLGYVFSHRNEENNEIYKKNKENWALPKSIPMALGQNFSGGLVEAKSYVGNLAKLQEATGLGGYFNAANVDEDGVFRRLPMITMYNYELYGSLSLSILQRYKGAEKITFITNSDNQLEAISVADLKIPVDAQGNLLIPFRGGQGGFPYISATKVLNEVDCSELKDKIVIVGTTAPGLLDLRSTPVQSRYAGVEVHANIISGLLEQTVKSRPTWIVRAEAIELVILLVLATTLFPRLSVITSALVFLVIVFIVAILNFGFWTELNLDTHLATPLFLFILLFGFHLFFGFFLENRKKKQLSNIFGQYIPKELVDDMLELDEEFSMKGEERVMTVFFSDVRGFTTISEAMENPQDLCDLINEILTPVTQVIHNHQGTIDKYIGDAIMAFWGAPIENKRHAYHAVKAGLDVIKSLESINKEFKLKHWPEVDLGIGLNTGAMVVGDMGSKFRIAYTVMGDTVNLGSRLEGLTKQYGVKMIVSESTVAAAPEFAYRELDCVRVKGKNKPITIYEPICELADISSEQQVILDLVQQALNDYRQQCWDKSAAIFQQLHDANPNDKLSKIYLERIEHYRQTPPEENWDGAFTHTSK